MPGNFPEGVVREGPTEVTFRVGDYSGRQWGKQSRKGEEPGKSHQVERFGRERVCPFLVRERKGTVDRS